MKNDFVRGTLSKAGQEALRGDGQTGRLSQNDGPLHYEPGQPDDPLVAKHPTFDREMLTVEDVAAMLSIGVRSVWRKAQDGRLPPPIKMTGSTRWAKSTLQDWITEQATAVSKKQHARGRR